MGRGITIGVLLSAVVFGGYYGWEKYTTKTDAPPETIDQIKTRVDYETRQQARADPRSAAINANPQNYPPFLTYLDLGEAFTQVAVDDYRQIFDRVAAYYANDTRGQILQAVFRIHEAKEYYFTLTYREALVYLQHTLPANFVAGESTVVSPKSVGEVANEIYDYQVAAYMKPQWDAMQQQEEYKKQVQANIDKNVAAAQARGAAYNQSRANIVANHNRQVQSRINREYNNYQANRFYRGYNSYYGRRYY